MTMGVALVVIALLVYFKAKAVSWPFLALAVVFFAAGGVCPRSLGLTYALWMRLAAVLAWINTRLILVVMFYLVFTPMGLAMRLFRADPLDRRIKAGTASYWKKKEDRKFVQSDYERQF